MKQHHLKTSYVYALAAIVVIGLVVNIPHIIQTPREVLKTVATHSSAVHQTAAVADFNSNLVLQYSFDDGTAADLSGRGNTGIVAGGAVSNVGQIGSALVFDGIDDTINAGSAASLDDIGSQGGMTVSFWINPRSNALGYLFAKGSASNNSGTWSILKSSATSPARISFGKEGATDMNANFNSVLVDNVWQHIVLTWDGNMSSGVNLYRNGVAMSGGVTVAGSGANSDAAHNLMIGSLNGTSGFADVSMDDVRVYNRVLTSAEIGELYSLGGSVVSPPSPINGLCGSSVNACSAGTLSDSTDTATENVWSCVGSNGGTTASCSAPILSQATSYNLTVSKNGTGAGTVTGSGISCGADCSESAGSGIVITLSAAASSGSTFTGWSGGGCSGTSSCSVTISSNTAVTATFNTQSVTPDPGQQPPTAGNRVDLLNSSGGVANTFATIQACASVAQSGQTCAVYPGTYNERVNVSNSGTSASPITFRAASATKPVVRAFSLSNKSYITIDGFELTHRAMTHESTLNAYASAYVSGGTGVRITNNFIHDTDGPCTSFENLSFLTISGNTLDHCGVATTIIGAPTGGTFTITAGVNDTVKIRLNNATSYNVTLTSGTRTLQQVCADINSQASGVYCHSEGADKQVHINPITVGPSTSVILENVAHDAYAALGLGVGNETQISHTAAFQSASGAGSTDVLVENNRVSRVSDFLLPKGSRYVYRNNILGPSDIGTAIHIDGVQSNAPENFLLIENNLSTNNSSSDNHFFLTSANSTNWIVRYNRSFQSKGGQAWGCGSCGTMGSFSHYNNTWYDTVSYYFGWNQLGLTTSPNSLSRNNIWYRAVRNPGGNPYYIGAGTTLDKDYDVVFESGNAQETHAINSDPLFTNATAGDFALRSTSPAIDAGGSLTLATAVGVNTTQLQVTNAAPFQDGWAGVGHDWIAVGTSGNYSEIGSINYANNTITLRTPLSWSAGAPVYLFKDSTGRQVLYGSAPDIGAYEYGGGALVLPPANPILPSNPPVLPANPVTCTSFTYSAWGTCTSGSQTRNILTSSPSGCTGGVPVTSQSCTVTPIVPPPPVPAINASCSNTLNQCIAGNYTDLPDTSANHEWSCLGSGTGINVSCSLAKTVAPANVTVPVVPNQPPVTSPNRSDSTPPPQPPTAPQRVVQKVIQTTITPNKSPYRLITDADLDSATSTKQSISDSEQQHSRSSFFERVKEMFWYVYSRILNGVDRLFGNAGRTQTAAVADFNSSLVAHYTFDDGTATDSSGKGNNGSFVGSPTAATGIIGGALQFNGSGDGVNAPIPVSSNGMTVSMWVKTTSTSLQTLFTRGGAGSGYAFDYRFGNRLNFEHNGSTDLAARTKSSSTLTPGTWYHVVFTWDGSTSASHVVFYNNGVSLPHDIESDGVALSDTAGFTPVIGSSFNGVIDDVRIYNRALSAQEVADLYTAGGGSVPASPPAAPANQNNTPANTSPNNTPANQPANDTPAQNAAPAQANAATCNTSDIQTAVNTVTDGGVVLVPAGTCTWTSPVTITNKSIILKGAGIDQTIITENLAVSDSSLHINSALGKPVRVTGFTFEGKNTRDNYASIGISGPPNQPLFRIDHIKFNNVTERGIIVNGAYGLIDHNIFIRNPTEGSPTLISVMGDSDASWNRPQDMGTSNAVFIEDNILVHNINANGPFDMYRGARYVFRNNNVYGNNLGHHGFDSDLRGEVNFEVYNNCFVNAAPAERAPYVFHPYSDCSVHPLPATTPYAHGVVFEFRSGSGVIFNNTVTRVPTGNNGGYYDVFTLLRNYRSGDGYITNNGGVFPWDGHSPWNGSCNGTNPLDGNLLDLDTNGDGVADKSSGYPCKDQIGRTSGVGADGKQTLSPVYSWNNNFQGAVGGHIVTGGYATFQCPKVGSTFVSKVDKPAPGAPYTWVCKNNASGVDYTLSDLVNYHIKEGRDYFNGVARPGYSPYVYPHPLTVSGFLSDAGGPVITVPVGNAAPSVAVPVTPPIIAPATPAVPPVTPVVTPPVTPPVVPNLTVPNQPPVTPPISPTVQNTIPPVQVTTNTPNAVTRTPTVVRNGNVNTVKKSPYRSLSDADIDTATSSTQETISTPETSFFGRIKEIFHYVYSRILNGVDRIFGYVGTTQTAAVADFDSNLVAYYSFDDGTATDNSGHGNGGTINGATPVAGKVGGALSFSAGSSVSIGKKLFTSYPATLCAWVKVELKGNGQSSKIIGNSGLDLVALESDGQERFVVYNGLKDIFTPYSSRYSAGEWHHVCGMADAGAQVNIYVDGVLAVGPSTIGTASTYWNAVVGSNFSGIIDEVRVYNSTLSASQVADVYNFSGGGSSSSGTDTSSGTGSGTGTGAGNPPAAPVVAGSCSASLNTCTAGTFTDVTDSPTEQKWSCVGSGGGTTASCSIPVPVVTPDPIIPDPVPNQPISNELIPADRLYDWANNVGVMGGIPVGRSVCASVKDAPYNAVGDGVADDTLAIVAAIRACAGKSQAVYFPAGTYKFTDKIIDQGTGRTSVNLTYSNTTFRGAGMGKTILKLNTNNPIYVGNGDWPPPAPTVTVTGGATRGSYTLTVDNASSIAEGKLITITQLNPDWVHSNDRFYGGGPVDDGHDKSRLMAVTVLVKSKSGNTITIDHPLPIDMPNSPMITVWTNIVKGTGFEDMTLDMSSSGALSGILFNQVYGCWVKGVEIKNAVNRFLWFTTASNCEVRDSYFRDARVTKKEGVDFYQNDTFNLIENNILIRAGGPMIILGDFGGGVSMNVVAYNYLEDQEGWSDVVPYALSDNHGAHNMFNLFEGNVAQNISSDGYYGGASHETLFRNRFTSVYGKAPNRNYDYLWQYAIHLGHWAVNYNVVGNVLGSPGYASVYQPSTLNYAGEIKAIYRLGFPDCCNSGFSGTGSNPTNSLTFDTNVEATLIRHGNFDYLNNTTKWSPNISVRSLPTSLYLRGQPSWWNTWGATAFPPIGPDVSGYAQEIPAKLRYRAIQQGNDVAPPVNQPAHQPLICSTFTYSAWGTCTAGTQSRSVLTSGPFACTGGQPVTLQSCTDVPMVPPVNARCSTVVDRCSAGIYTDMNDSTLLTIWSCRGSNGGESVSCSLPKVDPIIDVAPANLPAPQVIQKPLVVTPPLLAPVAERIISNISQTEQGISTRLSSYGQNTVQALRNKSPYRLITDSDLATSSESDDASALNVSQWKGAMTFSERVSEVLSYIVQRILNGVAKVKGYF